MDVRDIAKLPSLKENGFAGGRDGLRLFAKSIFAADKPRFLRDDDNNLVVFRNRDLQRVGVMPEVGNVPPAVLFGTAMSSSGDGSQQLGAEVARVISNQVFTTNAPIHKPTRRALVARLGPKQVKLMEPQAREIVDTILDDLDLSESIDIVHEVAERLTCAFWGRILEMDDAEVAAMERYTRELTRLFYFEPTIEDFQALDAAAKGFGEVIGAAAQRCVDRGENELVTTLAADLAQIALEDDPDEAGIVPPDVGSMLAGNLIDGFHTAALGAANTVYALLKNPDAFAQVAASRDLLPSAIFEALRMEPPVIMLKRWVMQDTILDDVQLKRGSVIVMMWGLGGFDPEVVPNPMQFDLSRSRQGSTTFGGGLHICPGRHVAVMLAQVLIEGILARELTLADAEEPVFWYPAHAMSQMVKFPLRFTKAR